MLKRTLSTLILWALAGQSVANAVTADELDTFLTTGDQCLSANLNRYIWVQGKDADWQNRTLAHKYKTAAEIYAAQSEKGFSILGNGPWDRALVPLYKAQTEAIMDAMISVDMTGRFLKGAIYTPQGNILNLFMLEAYLRGGNPTELYPMLNLLMNAANSKKKNLSEILNRSEPDGEYLSRAKNAGAISLACSSLAPTLSADCTRAALDMLHEAAFHSNMILPHLWNEFVSTQKLRDGVRHVALVQIQRLISRKPGKLFEDFTLGFEKAGFPQKEAVEAAWKLLALYGNGGPNTAHRLFMFDLPQETSAMLVALSLIGTAIGQLEFSQMISHKSHYAFPAQAEGCLTPKPYHFWLNAYFARWLVKKGYSSDVAQAATFVLAKGYQLNRDITGAGGGADKILSKTSDHPTNEVIRIDLTMAAAGAVYGSLVVGNHPIKSFSLLKGLDALNQARGNVEELKQDWIQKVLMIDQLKLWRSWEGLFQPDEALKYFRNEQGLKLPL